MRATAIVGCLICTVSWAADWPQYQGPFRNNSTPEIVQPWPGQLTKQWSREIGEGYSPPIVADGKLYLHARVGQENVEEVLALDAVTGEQIWRFAYPHDAFESNVGDGPRGAPLVAPGRVYTYGITGVLTCLDAKTGAMIWQSNPMKELGGKPGIFGAVGTPVLDGSRLIVHVSVPGSALAAVDTTTGKTLWTALDGSPRNGSPIVFMPSIQGRGIVRHGVFTSTRGLVGFDLATGATLWEATLANEPVETVSTPFAAGNLLVWSSMITGTIGLTLHAEQGRIVPRIEWKNADVTTYFNEGMAVGNELYVIDSTLIPEADIALCCLDAKTGQELWRKPEIGVYDIDIIRTGNGKLLLLDDLAGDLILLEPNREEYRELARSSVCRPTIISPAIANGRLYTRDDQQVNCISLTSEASAAASSQ